MQSSADNTQNPCVGCNYSLAGLPLGCTCPECGKASPDPNAHTADTIDKFCFCTTCCYHLFTLKKTDNCPECGNPAADSTIEQSIYRSGSTYLNTLRKGYQSITLGILILTLGFLFTTFGGPVVSLLSRAVGTTSLDLFGILQLAFLAALVAGAFFLLFGAIKATAKDPYFGICVDSEKPRLLTRTMAYINFFLYMPGIFRLPLFIFTAGQTGALLIMATYAAAAVTLVLASTVYTTRIATRIGTKKLIKTSTKSSAAIQILIVLMVIFALPLHISISGSPGGTLLVVTGIGLSVTMLASFLVYAHMLTATSRELKRALKRGMTIPTTASLKDAAPIATDPPIAPDTNP